MMEHKQAVKNTNLNNALAVHVSKTHHNILWNETRGVASEEHRISKRAVSLYETETTSDNNFNLDQGFQLDNN